MPGLGSRLSTYWPTKRSTWRCSQHTSVDQTPIPCIPVASPGFKQNGGGGVYVKWRADTPAFSNWARSTRLALQSHPMQQRRDWGTRCAYFSRNITNVHENIFKWLDESLEWARTAPSSLECLSSRRGHLKWWCRLNPSRMNADASTSTKVSAFFCS